MSEMHIRQLRFTYGACGPFTKNKEIQKFKETGDSQYIYQKELDKACFKDLPRTASNKVLHDKAFNIAKTPKYDAYCFNGL